MNLFKKEHQVSLDFNFLICSNVLIHTTYYANKQCQWEKMKENSDKDGEGQKRTESLSLCTSPMHVFVCHRMSLTVSHCFCSCHTIHIQRTQINTITHCPVQQRSKKHCCVTNIQTKNQAAVHFDSGGGKWVKSQTNLHKGFDLSSTDINVIMQVCSKLNMGLKCCCPRT